ncbi:hypothetical protein [Ehrlichia ruminantium]|nr:hypothetical protein [Ehrlichia ruminantium]
MVQEQGMHLMVDAGEPPGHMLVNPEVELQNNRDGADINRR